VLQFDGELTSLFADFEQFVLLFFLLLRASLRNEPTLLCSPFFSVSQGLRPAQFHENTFQLEILACGGSGEIEERSGLVETDFLSDPERAAL
jgi:hypothetical protein